MRRGVWLAILIALSISLTACAKPHQEGTRVKCPACGYEFEVPAPNP